MYKPLLKNVNLRKKNPTNQFCCLFFGWHDYIAFFFCIDSYLEVQMSKKKKKDLLHMSIVCESTILLVRWFETNSFLVLAYFFSYATTFFIFFPHYSFSLLFLVLASNSFFLFFMHNYWFSLFFFLALASHFSLCSSFQILPLVYSFSFLHFVLHQI